MSDPGVAVRWTLTGYDTVSTAMNGRCGWVKLPKYVSGWLKVLTSDARTQFLDTLLTTAMGLLIWLDPKAKLRCQVGFRDGFFRLSSNSP